MPPANSRGQDLSPFEFALIPSLQVKGRFLALSWHSLRPALRAMCLDGIRALVLIICLPTLPAHPAAWAFMSVTAELPHHPRPCFSRTLSTLKAWLLVRSPP